MFGQYFLLKAWLIGVAAAVFLQPLSAFASGCHVTPAQALDSSISSLKGLDNEGYRLDSVRWDPLLQRQWAVVRSCEHPDLPPLMLPVNRFGQRASAKALFLIVHAGDIVHIESQEEFVRVEMTGIAEESGVVGGRVRVHVLRPQMNLLVREQTGFDSSRRPLQTIVRGPHQVEIAQ